MRILVTGATGGLGRNLVERLIADNETVRATGRNKAVGRDLLKIGADFRPADIEDGPALEELCRDQEVVFHNAGLSSPWGQAKDFFAANVIGTANIVAACQKQRVRRLVHVSTPSIYFDFTDRLGIPENASLPKRPVNDYAKTKLEAEEIVRSASGLETIILRPRAIFGPHDTTLFPRLIRVASRGRVPLIGGGRALIDVTYVGNLVDAMIVAATAPADVVDGRIYNITNGEPIQVRELLLRTFDALEFPVEFVSFPYGPARILAGVLEAAAKLLPSQPEPPLTRYTVGVMAKSQTLDITAARRDLGYAPRISVDEGIVTFAKWWRSHS